jgi:hypothetical protein
MYAIAVTAGDEEIKKGKKEMPGPQADRNLSSSQQITYVEKYL